MWKGIYCDGIVFFWVKTALNVKPTRKKGESSKALYWNISHWFPRQRSLYSKFLAPKGVSGLPCVTQVITHSWSWWQGKSLAEAGRFITLIHTSCWWYFTSSEWLCSWVLGFGYLGTWAIQGPPVHVHIREKSKNACCSVDLQLWHPPLMLELPSRFLLVNTFFPNLSRIHQGTDVKRQCRFWSWVWNKICNCFGAHTLLIPLIKLNPGRKN